MKTFVIVQKDTLVILNSYQSEFKDDSSANRSHLMAEPICSHLELPEDMSVETVSAELVDGEIVLFTDAAKVQAVLVAQKTAQVQKAYDQMNAEVLAKMAEVFGTTKTDSATAYKETWALMDQSPAEWASAGLTAAFAVAELQIGEALCTEERVKAYAEAKLLEVKNYGIWRMQRIEAFKQERDTIMNQQ